MKILLPLLMLTQFTVVAQHKIKKVIVEGEGTPIVMLAGGTGDLSTFGFASKELSRNYKVIRMQHFNVQSAEEGLSFPQHYSVRTESEAIKYTLDSLQVSQPVVLVGHSYGGVMALDFALNHPNRIQSLVLIEPPAFGIAETKKESPAGMMKMQELLRELTPQAEITEELVERFRCALLICDTFSIRQHPQWTTWIKQKNRLRGLSAVGEYQINIKKLHQFRKPVLIITGTETAPFHKRIDELLTEAFPNAREVRVKSNHGVPTMAPKELMNSIIEFLQ